MNNFKIVTSDKVISRLFAETGAAIKGFKTDHIKSEHFISTTYTLDSFEDVLNKVAGEDKYELLHSDIDTAQTIPIHQILIDALQEERKILEEKQIHEQIQKDRHARFFFAQLFGKCPDSVHNGLVESDGIRLMIDNHWGNDAFKIQGTCLRCGQVLWSKAQASLPDIAKQMNPETFEPEHHSCKTQAEKEQKAKNTEERFLDVLVELIEEYSYSGE